MGELESQRVDLPLNLSLVPLHSCPKLTASCAELLNKTWPRSMGARMHSLEQSCHEFPVCLVLIGNPEGPVLGHARLCKVIRLHDSLFVESVVVRAELRGRGYGKKLMEATEKYARTRGFRNLHLTTHDKQDFYHHLGYQLAEPVQNMGNLGTLLPIDKLQCISTPVHTLLPIDKLQCISTPVHTPSSDPSLPKILPSVNPPSVPQPPPPPLPPAPPPP
ncbi:hypothetical protein GDO86_007320, partial [Hymenochirus boettgeri]